MSPFEQFVDGIHPAFLDGDPVASAKATEAEHVRLLREMYAAIARGDSAAFAAAFADDIELEIVGPPQYPFAGHWKGRQNVLGAVANNLSILEDQRPVIESVVAQGDTVVVVFDEVGRVKATGRSYQVRCVQLYTFRNGHLVRVRQVADSAPLIAACRVDGLTGTAG